MFKLFMFFLNDGLDYKILTATHFTGFTVTIWFLYHMGLGDILMNLDNHVKNLK